MDTFRIVEEGAHYNKIKIGSKGGHQIRFRPIDKGVRNPVNLKTPLQSLDYAGSQPQNLKIGA